MSDLSIEQYMAERGISEEEVAQAERRLDERITTYRLKEARRTRHLTQRQLASSIGISQKRISILENGDVGHVQMRTLERYIRGLGGELHVQATLPDGITIAII